jgi:hypothetical protein
VKQIERERVAELVSSIAQKVVNTFQNQGIPAPLGKCVAEFISKAKPSDTQQELRELAIAIVIDHEVTLSLTIGHRPIPKSKRPKLLKGGVH